MKGAITTTMSTTFCEHCGDELEGSELTLCRECRNEADGLCRWCGERPPADGEVCDPCAERSAIAVESGGFDGIEDLLALRAELAELPETEDPDPGV
jgi:hypothetical protein